MDKILNDITNKIRYPNEEKPGFDILYDEVKNCYEKMKITLDEFKILYGKRLKNYPYWGTEFIYVMRVFEKLGTVKKINDHYCLISNNVSILIKKPEKEGSQFKKYNNDEKTKRIKCVWKYPLLRELLSVYQEREAWKEKQKEVLREDGSIDVKNLF